MARIHPHINFNGNAEEAFRFYRAAFGGDFSQIVRFGEMPDPGFPIPESEATKIMHIALPIGDNLLMGNDVPSFMGRTNEEENRSKIVISAESKAEADHLFAKLAAGGTVEMPLDQSPWGTYFGMFRDQFGIEWMIEFDENRK